MQDFEILMDFGEQNLAVVKRPVVLMNVVSGEYHRYDCDNEKFIVHFNLLLNAINLNLRLE